MQEKSATMTQARKVRLRWREYAQMQEKYQQRQMALEQDLKKATDRHDDECEE